MDSERKRECGDGEVVVVSRKDGIDYHKRQRRVKRVLESHHSFLSFAAHSFSHYQYHSHLIMSSEQEDQQQRQQQSLHSSSSSLDLPTTPLAASNNLSPSATQSLPLAPLGDQLILPSDMKNSPIIVPSSPAETLRAETLPTPPTPDAVQPSVTSASHLLQQSLSINNLEQEVGQVMGTFNSWWGGVKKQVRSNFPSSH